MKKLTLLLTAAFIFSPVASADVLMKWTRKPLPVDLQIEKERIIFVDKGQILENETPEEFFTNPKHERAKQFLQQVMTH